MVYQKDHVVTKGCDRNLGLVLAVAALGTPIGGSGDRENGPLGMVEAGMANGLVIDFAVGLQKDKKSFQNDRQLNTALKYDFFFLINSERYEFTEIYGKQCPVPFMGNTEIC